MPVVTETMQGHPDNNTHLGQATEDADLNDSEIDIPKPKVDKGKGKAKPRPTVVHKGVRKTILTKEEAIELGLICLKCDRSSVRALLDPSISQV